MVGSKDMHITYQKFLEKGGTNKSQVGNTIIHVNSLDNLLIKEHGISEFNWMKIDVEGAELDVLKGARNILSNSRRINLLIEIHGVNEFYIPIVEYLIHIILKLFLRRIYKATELETGLEQSK